MGSRATRSGPCSRCNNGCVFCAQAGVTGGAPLGEQLEAARREGDEVTLVGGEPTLDPRLAEHVAGARRMGFVRVGLQTNGRRLGEPGYVAELARAGLTDVHLSIHGAESAAHDYHTGVAGSFDAALTGLAAVRASGLTAVVNTVLTRSSFRSLAGMPRVLSSRGVAGWRVSIPRSAGRLSADFDRLMPRLGLAVPFALSALAAGEKLALEVGIAGAPRCLLGEYTRWALDDLPHVSRAPHTAQGPTAPRAFAEACEGCPARAHCPGLDTAYLEALRRGRARTGSHPHAGCRGPLLAARLAHHARDVSVGPGEAPGAVLRPPARRRRTPAHKRDRRSRSRCRWPRKVRPAVAGGHGREPSPQRERRWKELFPGLFEGRIAEEPLRVTCRARLTYASGVWRTSATCSSFVTRQPVLPLLLQPGHRLPARPRHRQARGRRLRPARVLRHHPDGRRAVPLGHRARGDALRGRARPARPDDHQRLTHREDGRSRGAFVDAGLRHYHHQHPLVPRDDGGSG